jgi:hypothetical protein
VSDSKRSDGTDSRQHGGNSDSYSHVNGGSSYGGNSDCHTHINGGSYSQKLQNNDLNDRMHVHNSKSTHVHTFLKEGANQQQMNVRNDNIMGMHVPHSNHADMHINSVDMVSKKNEKKRQRDSLSLSLSENGDNKTPSEYGRLNLCSGEDISSGKRPKHDSDLLSDQNKSVGNVQSEHSGNFPRQDSDSDKQAGRNQES